MVVIIDTNAAKYFHLITADGTYGVIELVDGQYRAEYYGCSIGVHSINDNEYWEQSPMYHVGCFDTLQEAVVAMLEEFTYPTDYIEELIRKANSVEIDDWLLEYKRLDEKSVDKYIQSCLNKLPMLPLWGYAKESQREAEFYVTHPDEGSPTPCYEREEYLSQVAELMDRVRYLDKRSKTC